MTLNTRRPGITIDPWDPGYAAALATEALAEFDASTAQLELDTETPAHRWAPLAHDPGTQPPTELLVADGVRRIDARVWVDDAAGVAPLPGIAASYAAGIVAVAHPDGDQPAAPNVQVERGLFTAAPHCPELAAVGGSYPPRPAADGGPDALSLALQLQLADLEAAAAVRYRTTSPATGDLLLLDGPLRGRTHLPRTVGYIKTHHAAYLPAVQATVVTQLAAAQRTPVFLIGTSWSRYTWYLRLPTRSSAPWAGVVRCEASPNLPAAAAIHLADLTTVALPPLAGVDYKDPRAPQNLVPIGGLEKLLRHRLGDHRVLYRALRRSAAQAGNEPRY